MVLLAYTKRDTRFPLPSSSTIGLKALLAQESLHQHAVGGLSEKPLKPQRPLFCVRRESARVGLDLAKLTFSPPELIIENK